MTCFGQYSELSEHSSSGSILKEVQNLLPPGLPGLCLQQERHDCASKLASRRGCEFWPPPLKAPAKPSLEKCPLATHKCMSNPANRVNDRRFLHAAEALGLLYIFTVTKLNPCTWLSPMQQGWEWVGISSIFSLLSSFQTFPIFPSNSSDCIHKSHILLLSLIVCHLLFTLLNFYLFIFILLFFIFRGLFKVEEIKINTCV